MPKWLTKVLEQLRDHLRKRTVRFTDKALREIEAIALDEEAALEILAGLGPDDFHDRIASSGSGEWMYIFKPDFEDLSLYVKFVIRAECVVVSLHEDRGEDDEA